MGARPLYLAILSLSGFVTSFGAYIVATNLPANAEAVGAGAFMIGLLIAVYDFAELFAKPAAGFIADRRAGLTSVSRQRQAEHHEKAYGRTLDHARVPPRTSHSQKQYS